MRCMHSYCLLKGLRNLGHFLHTLFFLYFPLIENNFQILLPLLSEYSTSHFGRLMIWRWPPVPPVSTPHPATQGQWEGKLAPWAGSHSTEQGCWFCIKMIDPASLGAQPMARGNGFCMWKEELTKFKPSGARQAPPAVLCSMASTQWPRVLAACPPAKKDAESGRLPHPQPSPPKLALFLSFSACLGRQR